MAGVDAGSLVEVGHITGVFGVQGWVKVHSYTEPRVNIGRYNPWLVCLDHAWRALAVQGVREHGKGVIALVEGFEDRDAARQLVGAEIAIRRDQLEAPAQGEYYWADLLGMKVITVSGIELGIVDHLVETGANDVLVVAGERERLIPFVRDEVIVGVDLDAGEIRVDWDPEF